MSVITARRLNPAAFGSPPSSACTLGTPGAYGPDRISKTQYDLAGRPVKTISAFATGAAIDVATTTYTANGLVKTLTDANGNKTTYDYDGFDRLFKTRFPSKTSPGTSSTTDYEQLTFSNAGATLGLLTTRPCCSAAEAAGSISTISAIEFPKTNPMTVRTKRSTTRLS